MIDLLVIEPSISTRKMLERLLESSGYSVRGVTRAADARRQVSRQRPDLVLSEVNLPDLGGLELCQQLRLIGLPVMLMSGEASPKLRLDSLAAGALELLSKPLSEQRLLDRLSYHLKLPVTAAPFGLPPSPPLLTALMNRPGILGVALLGRTGEPIEQLGQRIPAALYQAFLPQLAAAEVLDTGALQSAQLEYAEHCLLLFRLPSQPVTLLVCLIQNSSYASLVRYHLRSSPYVRL